jgi:hypothetical protein
MHTQNVNSNVKVAGEETAGRWGENTSVHHVVITKSPVRRLLADALDAADYSVACEQEACHHYGDRFTRMNHVTTWISGFLTVFHIHLLNKEEHRMSAHNLNTVAKKIKPGTSPDLLPLLQIRLSDTHVAEFDKVDTRFNDCCNWQVMEGEELVLFSTRMHEQFRDVKSGLMATVAVCEGHPLPSDARMLAAAKLMLKLLDACPSFASLAAYPARIDNA